MRSLPGSTDPDKPHDGDGGASQRTSGELSSVRRHDSPGFASDDQRPLMYVIPAIVAGLVLIIAGAVAVMYLWKRRQQRRDLGKTVRPPFSIIVVKLVKLLNIGVASYGTLGHVPPSTSNCLSFQVTSELNKLTNS